MQRVLHMRPGAAFVDIGANIGYFSFVAAAHGRDVVLFEPNPYNTELVNATVAANNWTSRVHVFQTAVAHEWQPPACTNMTKSGKDNLGNLLIRRDTTCS